MLVYDAFISYSHALDKPIAAELQRVIQTLGKPWYRLRASRIFRDDTNLAAAPELWPNIVKSLEASRFLILLASPEAGRSKWVDKEVQWWLENRGADSLLIGLTSGDLVWSEDEGGFLKGPNFPLPPALDGRLRSEPLWIDLRPWRKPAQTAAAFKSLASKLAARVRGVPLENLWSEELRQQKRNLRLAGSAIAGLILLTAAAVLGFFRAAMQERQALANEARAQMQLAIVHSERSASGEALRAALDGVEAAGRAAMDLAAFEQDLYEVSGRVGRGLVAAGELKWPEDQRETDEPRWQMRFVPTADRDAPTVCIESSRFDVGKHSDNVFEHCFSIKEGAIVWRPDVESSTPYPTTTIENLSVAFNGDRVEFREPDLREGAPFHSMPRSAFGGQRVLERMIAGRCPAGDILLVETIRNEAYGEEATAGADTPQGGTRAESYLVSRTSGEVSRIDSEIWSDGPVCSPYAPVVAGSGGNGPLRFYAMPDEEPLVEFGYELARQSSNPSKISFTDKHLALIPSMLKADGSSTLPLVAVIWTAHWSKVKLELPRWQNSPAGTGALSADSKYAALLHDNGVLSVWDLAGLGLHPSEEPAHEPNRDRDWETLEGLVKTASSDVRAQLPDTNFRCVFTDLTRSRLIAYGKNRLVTFDIAAKTILSDQIGTFLDTQEDEDCAPDAATRDLIEIQGGYKAVCNRYMPNARQCRIFVPGSKPPWLAADALASGCLLAFRSNDLWICGLGELHSREPKPSIALINWAKTTAAISDDRYFAHIFDDQHGFANFEVTRSQACPRALVSYHNWSHQGGTPQPDGALILDEPTGRVVAHVPDPEHPIFCTVGELVDYMKKQVSRHQAMPVAVGAATAANRPTP